MSRSPPAPSTSAVVTVLRAPEHLARRFHQVCDSILASVFAAQGLVGWQFALLVQLRATPGLDGKRLAAAIGRDATSTGQALDMLVGRGLVDRRVQPKDRRAWSFTATPAGVALHEAMRPEVIAHSRRITAPLTPAELETLLDLLTRLVVSHETHARPGAGRRPPRRRGSSPAEAEGSSPCTIALPSSAGAPHSASASSSAPSLVRAATRRSRNPPRPA